MAIYWTDDAKREGAGIGPRSTRTIRVPEHAIRATLDPDLPGIAVVVPVKVGWPELQLTEAQILVNAIARVMGEPPPYPDRSIFDVVLPRPASAPSADDGR